MNAVVRGISEGNWACSICLNLMDGHEETNGSVCISTRCMHIFHRACVERAIDQSRACPLCRHQIAVCFLVDNPNHEEQCQAWNANREGYTLDNAFFQKYGKTPEQMELRVEDIVRPESLHGQDWNPEISSEDKSRYYHECVGRGYSFQEIFDAEDQVLDSIRDSFAEMRASNAEMRANNIEMHRTLDRIEVSDERVMANHERMMAKNARMLKNNRILKEFRAKRAQEIEDQANQNRIRKARMKRCAYLCLFAVAATGALILWKKGIPSGIKFWNGKSIKQLT